MATEELLHQPGCKERLNLSFQHLSYSLPSRKGSAPAHILRDVSGQFNSGRLTAIMGASGAGKTSLLNVLSGFKTKGVSGSVRVNGVERDEEEFRTKSCHIVQHYSMLPLLTCQETLTVAANLKLKPGWRKHKATRSVVTNILGLLGLTSVRNTSVQSLSGGEKKRLSVGQELVSNPPIMFFDEPTSGLDSVAAAQMILHLQTLSALGHAIICVIHQPSSHIFNMFDDLYLLSDGQCLYSGPTADMVRVFQQAGFTCPEYYNRADFAIDVACRQMGDDLSNLFGIVQLNAIDLLSQVHTDVILQANTPMLTSTLVTVTEDKLSKEEYNLKSRKKTMCRRYPTSCFQQFIVLLLRSFTCTLRNIHTAHMMLGSNIGVALLLGVVYFDVGNDAGKVESNLACLFVFVMFIFLCNAMTATCTFPQEMTIFLQEHLNNWYSLPSYFFAKIFSNFPVQFVCNLSFVLIGYYMTGQPGDVSRLLRAMLVFQLLPILTRGVGLVVGVLFQIELGVFVVSASSVPLLLFGGFLIRLQDVSPYLQWLSTVSYFRHANEALVVAVYGFGRQKLACSRPYCHYRNPQKLLEDLGMSEDNYWMDICGLVAWIFGIYLVFFAVLKWRIQRSK